MKEPSSFGPYLLHWEPLRLSDGRRTVALSNRQLEVLSLLVQAHGEIVPKRAFLEKVWNGRFVEDGNLTQTIFLLRRALGRFSANLEYIETVPRQGYRFAARALQNENSASSLSPSPGRTLHALGEEPSEERFRLLLDSIEDYAVYMLDCAGRVRTWNAGAVVNKGYARQEILGQHYSLFFVPEDIEARVPDLELAAAATRGRCAGEGWRIRKNGERFWASFVLSAIHNPAGRLVGFAKVVRDLSEHKRQEEAMLRAQALAHRERDRLHAAVESSMDAFFLCEAVRNADGEIQDFTFTYLNSNVEKMVAIPRDTLLGGSMLDLLPVNRSLGLFEEYKRVVLTRVPFSTEFPIRDPDIACEWIRVQAVPLENGLAITAADITERKRSESHAWDPKTRAPDTEGTTRDTVQLRPGLCELRTRSRPWCRFTISELTHNPSPVPPIPFVVKKRRVKLLHRIRADAASGVRNRNHHAARIRLPLRRLSRPAPAACPARPASHQAHYAPDCSAPAGSRFQDTQSTPSCARAAPA